MLSYLICVAIYMIISYIDRSARRAANQLQLWLAIVMLYSYMIKKRYKFTIYVQYTYLYSYSYSAWHYTNCNLQFHIRRNKLHVYTICKYNYIATIFYIQPTIIHIQPRAHTKLHVYLAILNSLYNYVYRPCIQLQDYPRKLHYSYKGL